MGLQLPLPGPGIIPLPWQLAPARARLTPAVWGQRQGALQAELGGFAGQREQGWAGEGFSLSLPRQPSPAPHTQGTKWRLGMQQCFLLPTSLLFHIKPGVSRTHPVPQDPQPSLMDPTATHGSRAVLLLGSIPPAPPHLSSKTQLLLDTGNGFLREHSISPEVHVWLFWCQCCNHAPQGPNPHVQDPHPCWTKGRSCCLLGQLVSVA